MGNYIELIKTLTEDSQGMIELKDNFNKDAQEMNLNWPRLSMERRRELCTHMKAIQSQIVDFSAEVEISATSVSVKNSLTYKE